MSKRFGAATVIDSLSATFRPGAISVLLGASGCGKTTTLRCIAGLETPDEGRIAVAGTDVFWRERGISLPPERRELAMVFQSYAIWPHMTVRENVGLPLRARRTRPSASPRARSTVRSRWSGSPISANGWPRSFQAASSNASRLRAASCGRLA